MGWRRIVRAGATLVPRMSKPAGASSNAKETSMSLILTSDNFTSGGPIPAIHTCDGANTSPALSWSGVPPDTRSLVLIVDDPDAPDPAAPKMTWVHWVLYNLPPQTNHLHAAMHEAELPPGTLTGLNDFKKTEYGGPCPPVGRHRYVHKLYALDTVLPNLQHPTKARLEKAMQGHVRAQGELIGTYQRGH
jgi:Raf kinase inhibitor-like YbhB/YbcL family protein